MTTHAYSFDHFSTANSPPSAVHHTFRLTCDECRAQVTRHTVGEWLTSLELMRDLVHQRGCSRHDGTLLSAKMAVPYPQWGSR